MNTSQNYYVQSFPKPSEIDQLKAETIALRRVNEDLLEEIQKNKDSIQFWKRLMNAMSCEYSNGCMLAHQQNDEKLEKYNLGAAARIVSALNHFEELTKD